jgi:hypothetical protein
MRAVGVRIGHTLFRPWLSGIGGEAVDPRETANPREFAALAATTQLTHQHRQFEERCLAPRVRLEPAIRWLTSDCRRAPSSSCGNMERFIWVVLKTLDSYFGWCLPHFEDGDSPLNFIHWQCSSF